MYVIEVFNRFIIKHPKYSYRVNTVQLFDSVFVNHVDINEFYSGQLMARITIYEDYDVKKPVKTCVDYIHENFKEVFEGYFEDKINLVERSKIL